MPLSILRIIDFINFKLNHFTYQVIKSPCYFAPFPRDDYLTIATTRPETLFGDTAVAVNPEVFPLFYFC